MELAPKEDQYLFWDKPLSEQSDKVKTAIESQYKSELNDKASGYSMDMTGEYVPRTRGDEPGSI